ncbi:MAG: DUF2764 domain-containing protein, partial [Alistipes sp.]|nr:DUF2764 domain-containing protein [Alistipes sp.]
MFGGNQYYGLVASLREQSSGGDGGSGYAEKGFDPDAVYGEIRRELSAGDRRTAGLLWSMMDIYGLERGRVEQLYGLCAASSCGFLRDWCRFDRNLRNVIAANTARAKGMVVADVLLDTNGDEIALSLAKSSAADFSLRGELDYIDRL